MEALIGREVPLSGFRCAVPGVTHTVSPQAGLGRISVWLGVCDYGGRMLTGAISDFSILCL